MIRFEVTGETAQEFAENAMKAWGLLAIGLQAALQPRTDALADFLREMQNTEAMSGSESSSTASKVTEPTPTLVADRADDLFVEKEVSAPAPESSASTPRTRTSAAKTAAKGPKLDDLKTRLSEVIVAATERWDQKRANAYARKLLTDLGVAKLSDLPPGGYSDFLMVSDAYLAGDAPE